MRAMEKESRLPVLDGWGGVTKVERGPDLWVIRWARGCPLSGSTAHDDLCRMMEALPIDLNTGRATRNGGSVMTLDDVR